MTSEDIADLRRRAETHRLIKGRQWRVSDPALDPATRQHLVDALMEARRSVKAALAADDDDAETSARRRVHDAKVALGERGPKWWEPMTVDEIDARVSSARRTLALRGVDESLAEVRRRLHL